ncbi:phosphoribosylglycinamide formyltransferase [Shewanella frigidimarina]|jgi:phosphoribosylglycinamide formyltransferase-1|uniref:Phosphoribosylglycinamide formyltransferase n=1 Tax=Shewanella frigidimarina (strain NCIMB 400) TaxID=318167 RepID=Q084L2_SHEFN|nr:MULTISPECIES: phosphoribosylglycinamide formyltransferase [Shewanella]ABI71303.1 phosphoribosylglycinamide formyltransferase [Shewanella frigidimarina NCIMB 400]MBB1428053.1 phosphoribosylglycinamide formyltransferase [Shewanella sp. SG44-2]PKI03813.1 phosphoribosylglycinamide formyltransferase [Shewanella sp. 11B5]RPA27455.1 phosphoribosylglycinamide formyltransferase [Shewanella frigidimarina]RPA62578.1 phosphoribosylglycinamide formyltransferase [Shewanella frigidimarina]|tara:strand:+ start:13025 stop:13669 length:645 start_codon:yes stop_codon:yes gene_type:complete
MSQSCRVVVLISGNGSNLQAIIDGCDDNLKAAVVGVISNKPDAYGLIRAHQSEIDTSCVIPYANEVRSDYDARLLKSIEKYQPDLIILAGFMRILTDDFVSHFLGKMINIHPSLLPKYTGLHTHQRAIDAGDKKHGASVHFVIPELDAGPVILQAKVPIYPEDDAEALAERVHEQEHAIYPLVVKWFSLGRLAMTDGKAYLDGELIGPSGYAPD